MKASWEKYGPLSGWVLAAAAIATLAIDNCRSRFPETVQYRDGCPDGTLRVAQRQSVRTGEEVLVVVPCVPED